MKDNNLVDIEDLDKAEVLLALYNNADLQAQSPRKKFVLFLKKAIITPNASIEDARVYLEYHDCTLKGLEYDIESVNLGFKGSKDLFVNLSKNHLDTTQYNKLYGHNKAERIISELREKHSTKLEPYVIEFAGAFLTLYNPDSLVKCPEINRNTRQGIKPSV